MDLGESLRQLYNETSGRVPVQAISAKRTSPRRAPLLQTLGQGKERVRRNQWRLPTAGASDTPQRMTRSYATDHAVEDDDAYDREPEYLPTHDEYEPSEAAYDDDEDGIAASRQRPRPTISTAKGTARLSSENETSEPTVKRNGRLPRTMQNRPRSASAPPVERIATKNVDDLPQMRFEDKTPAYLQVSMDGENGDIETTFCEDRTVEMPAGNTTRGEWQYGNHKVRDTVIESH